MKITCPNCKFDIQTTGEGFRLTRENLKFCNKCGNQYPAGFIGKMFEAERAYLVIANRYFNWTMGIALSCLALYAAYINTVHPNYTKADVDILEMRLLEFLVMLGISLSIGIYHANKKFKQVAGQ